MMSVECLLNDRFLPPGLPPGTTIDEKYVLNTDTNYTNNDNHYVLVGYTATHIHYDKVMARWEVKVRTDPETK